MEFIGKLVKKTNEREGTSKRGNHYKIAEYLIETDERYPQKAVVTVMDGERHRIELFDSHIGMDVTVSFDLNAREYEGRYYNQLDAWGIVAKAKQQPSADPFSAKTDDLPY